MAGAMGKSTMRMVGALGGIAAVAQRIRPPADLTDQVALITGSSRGLGLLVARELADAGCKLVICARDAEELAEAEHILLAHRAQVSRGSASADQSDGNTPARPLEILAMPCDLTDRAQIQQLVDRAIARFGRIDILVNVAGIIQITPLENSTRADFESAMDTMFWAIYDTTMAVLPGMLERRYGRIVNVTSVGGKISVPHLLPYCSAKFAATGFSEGLTASLAGKNVTVTTIVPGLMRTGSILNVQVKGDKPKEFGWFSALDSLPFISMDADRAARQIVAALRQGKPERILTLPANLGARTMGLAPNLTIRLLALTARLLPPPVAGDGNRPTFSRTLANVLDQPVLHRLTTLSRRAAARNNELADDGRGDGRPPSA